MCRWRCSVVLLAIGLTLGVPPANGDDPKPCQRYRLASLDIVYDAGGRPTVEATVNGTKVHMLVDTGAIDSELSFATVQRLKLRTERLEMDARVYDAGGVPIISRATADTFSIGVMSGTNWPFLVSPEHSVALAEDDDGVLGPDILAQYDVEFDFGANKINIFTHDECPGRVAYWTQQPFGTLPFDMDGYHMLARATLDGESVDVMIDTGASVSNMTDKTAREIMSTKPDPARMKQVEFDVGDSESHYLYQFKMLDLNGLKIENPEFLIYPERNAAIANLSNRRPTVVLGLSTLRQLHLYIAYREKVMYFTPAGAH